MAANSGPGYSTAFALNRPFVLGVQNQIVSYCGYGVCEPALQNSVSALEPFRYATGLFVWKSAITQVPTSGTPGPSAADTDGNNLALLSQNSSLLLFQAGVGDNIPISDGSTWWVNTISDTDLLRSGAPNDRGLMFLATGMTVETPEPFQRGGTFALASDPKVYSAWLERQENGPGYGQAIQQAMQQYTGFLVAFSDAGTTFRIGVAAFYPQWGGPSGSQSVTNGQTSTPGTYLPFNVAICMGSRDDVRQLSLTATVGQPMTVQSNPTTPTVAGSTLPGVINSLNKGDVFAPVRVLLVGYMVCVPCDNVCGLPALSPAEIVAVKSQLGIVSAPQGTIFSGPNGMGIVPTPG